MFQRRRGAVALMSVVAMIPVTAMFAANMNAGQMIEDRRKAQDAADAIAGMHAAWSARSLNVISMNNVTTAQLLTVAIGSEALAGTLDELKLTAIAALSYVGGHALINCPTRQANPIAAAAETIAWTIPCGIQHGIVAAPAIKALNRVSQINRDFDPDYGVSMSDKALRAIEGMNRAIIGRFPHTIEELGRDYARQFGIDDFHFADPCDSPDVANCRKTDSDYGMALPVEDGGLAAHAEFCAAMMTGTTIRMTSFSTRGFPTGKGPMRFGGSSSRPVVKDHINATTGIGSALKDFKDFYKSSKSDLWAYIYAGPDKHPQIFNLIPNQNKDGPNSFTIRYDAKYASVCGNFSVPVNGLLRLSIEAQVPTIWQLKGIGPVSVPKVQPDEMPDPFRILAYTQKDKSKRLAALVLQDAVTSHYGYAQAGLFNPDGADLFSANWRYRMMPATRLDNAQVAGQKLKSQAHAVFGELADRLTAVSDTVSWNRINAH